jgi:hypothetical protein
MRALSPVVLAHAPFGALAPVLGRRLRLGRPRGGLRFCRWILGPGFATDAFAAWFLGSRPRDPSASLTGSSASRRGAPVGAARYPALRGRGRLVDYGAALEMRFGATHRGFESRPLRHTRPARSRTMRALSRCGPRSRTCGYARSGPRLRLRLARARGGLACWRAHVDLRQYDGSRHFHRRPGYPSRAVLGGELAVPCSLQSAPAGPNPLSRSPFSVAARRCDVEDRVPRSGEPRIVSGPEGSSTKRSSSGAAERPGPSRPSWWARATVDRRRVHGI